MEFWGIGMSKDMSEISNARCQKCGLKKEYMKGGWDKEEKGGIHRSMVSL